MKKEQVFRWTYYIFGMIVLACGITLNTKTQLGVSPIISVSYCLSVISKINFGDMTFGLYVTFVLIEAIIHVYMKRYKVLGLDAGQVLISLIFTRILNVFSVIIPDFMADLGGTVWGSMPSRIAFLIIAIIFTGVGAALTLNARLIPNPGDGIVQAISDLSGKSVGFIKNCVDISCVVLTCVLGFFLVGRIVGIGVGTLLAMIGVGRVIAAVNHFWFKG